jgi:tRNA (guanine-N7-)-methyltransferase
LSAHQVELLESVLPRVGLDLSSPCPAPVAALFARPVSQVWLEIGFGGAEHLVWQASQNPNVGLIGCEVFEDGVVKALASIEEHGLANVRIAVEDARDLLRWLPGATLARVFILFPDPWPKKRHVKRRLVAGNLFALLARAMAPGAELRIATDIGDYARTMLLAAREHPDFVWQAAGPEDWRVRGSDWPATRYEGKATAEGRRCYFFRFRKNCP